MTEVTRLANGLQVVMETMPYLKTVSFGIWVSVGSASEVKSNNGISHMIEHMLFKGTKTRTAKQIADLISRIGDDINAFTGKEVTCYYGSTVTESLDVMIELLADMLQHSAFDRKDISKEKRVICDEIDMYEDSPEDLVHELLQQKVFDKHPLGFIISGNKSVVRAFSRQQLLNYMNQFYTAENIVISVAGNFEKEGLLHKLNEALGEIPSGNSKAGMISANIKKLQTVQADPYSPRYTHRELKSIYHRCFCTRNKEIEQLHINLAFPAITIDSPQNDVFSIFNSILGGSNNSRLFQKIREELGLAYSIYSYGSFFEQAGLFHIDITINPSQAEIVLEHVINALNEMINDGITEEELLTHKSQVMTEFIMSSESAKARMNSNAKSLMVRGYIRGMEEVTEELKKVTLEEVNQIARQILKLRDMSICLVGPKGDESFIKIKKKWQRLKEE